MVSEPSIRFMLSEAVLPRRQKTDEQANGSSVVADVGSLRMLSADPGRRRFLTIPGRTAV